MKTSNNYIAKLIWFSFGVVFLILGVIGLVLPIIPGFLFLIPSAFCFAKSSKKFHEFIKHNGLIGKYFI